MYPGYLLEIGFVDTLPWEYLVADCRAFVRSGWSSTSLNITQMISDKSAFVSQCSVALLCRTVLRKSEDL